MRKYIAAILLLALSATACQKAGVEEEYVSDDPASYIDVKVEQIAGLPWTDGEKVNVNGLISLPYDTKDSLVFKIKKTAGVPYYTAWPHNAVSGYSNGSAHLDIPATQSAEEEKTSVYLGKASEGNIVLHNCLCKVTIQSKDQYELRKVKITSADGTPIAGAFTTDYETLEPAVYGASDCISVDATGAASFEIPVSFLMVPGDYTAEGFKITLTETDGTSTEYTVIPEKAYTADGAYNLELGAKPVGSKLQVRFADESRKWHEGDVINLNGRTSEALTEEFEGQAIAEFQALADDSPYCVAFPADAVYSFTEGYATISITDKQDPDENYDTTLLGRADDSFVTLSSPFCNLELTSEEAVDAESIRIESLDKKSMAGIFVTDYWTVRPGSETVSKSIVLSKTGGGNLTLPATLTLVPDDYTAKGFKISLKTAEGLEEYTVIPAQKYTAGGRFALEIKNKPIPPAPKWYIEVAPLTSSSAVLTWTGEDPKEDFNKPYTVQVFKEESCQTAVATYNIPANAGCWKSTWEGCHFAVGHLDSGTDYWFTVTSGELVSEPAALTTAEFTVVPMVSSISTTGVVFAENFGEFGWADDYILSAGGYVPSDISSFANKNTAGALFLYEEYEKYAGFRRTDFDQAFKSSRLDGWLSEGKVYMHPGYLKLGTSSTYGFILTPKFNIAGGKTATVDVTVTASRINSSQNTVWSVAVIEQDGDKGGRESDFTWPNTGDPTLYQEPEITGTGADWDVVTVSGLKIKSGNRIEFGRAKNGSNSKARVLVSGISVKVTSID